MTRSMVTVWLVACLATTASFAQAPNDAFLTRKALPDAPSATLESMAGPEQWPEAASDPAIAADFSTAKPASTISVSGNSDAVNSGAANPSSAQSAPAVVEPNASSSKVGETGAAVDPQKRPAEFESRNVHWTATMNESFFFLSMQHGMRMVQKKTRRELGGRWFHDYLNAVSGLGGWGDGDSTLTNYVGHPMMGAGAGWILIQNDPKGKTLEFNSRSGAYWRSRLKAMGWAAIYSTQFELGPVSEASIGNVGRKRGTAGFVDLVMTPVGGFGWIVAEDAVDKHLIRKLEQGRSDEWKRFVRMFFNPNRTAANLFRLKKPWMRDGRRMDWDK